MSGYEFKGNREHRGRPLSWQEWDQLMEFWNRLALDYYAEIFDDPKKSFFHIWQEERRHCFHQKWKTQSRAS